MRRALALCIAAGALALACSRSGLRADVGEHGVIATSSIGSAGGGPGSGGAGGGDTSPPPCALQMVGAPIAPSFAGVPTTSGTVVAVHPGDAATQTPAMVAMQSITTGDQGFPHPVNLAIRLAVGREWPGGVVMEKEAVVFGVESHSYAIMARSAAPANRLVLGYVGDPGGAIKTVFRAMDADAWLPDTPVTLDAGGDPVGDIAPGAGVEAKAYAGTGYAVSWTHSDPPNDASTIGRVAVVDEAGAITLGPVDVTGLTSYPGAQPRVVWTGATYLVAVSQHGCLGALCALGTVTLGELRPGAAPAYQILHDWKALDMDGARPGRVSLARVAGEVWAIWAEGIGGDPPTRLRLVRMRPDGSLLGETSLTHELLLTYRISLLGGALVPPSVSWIVDGDPSLDAGALGRSFMITQPLRPDDGTFAGPAVEAPIYGVANDYLTTAATRYPHGLLATFGTGDEVYMHRLDCGDTLPLQADTCKPCPAAPPSEAAACDAPDGLFCAYPSKTPKGYNASRCESGAWRHYGAGAPPPLDGCPIELPSGPCLSGPCVYSEQDSYDYATCACEAGQWSCHHLTKCE